MKYATRAAVLLILASGCQVRTVTPPEKAAPPAGAPAPVTGMDINALFLSGADREQFSLSSYRGRVLVLDFWATWDSPSRAQMPALKNLAQEWLAQDVALIGMAVDRGNRDAVADAVKALNLSYPVAWADDHVLSAFGGIRAMPTKVFVDKTGKIRKQLTGIVPEAMLRAEVSALLAEN